MNANGSEVADKILPARRNPARWLFDLFSNVSLGITLLVLLFLFMSIGSAGIVYPVHPTSSIRRLGNMPNSASGVDSK